MPVKATKVTKHIAKQGVNKMDKAIISLSFDDGREDNYRLTQYIIEDEGALQISKFECEYRATRREEMTKLLYASGCSEVVWKFPDETGFYQPIVVAKK